MQLANIGKFAMNTGDYIFVYMQYVHCIIVRFVGLSWKKHHVLGWELLDLGTLSSNTDFKKRHASIGNFNLHPELHVSNLWQISYTIYICKYKLKQDCSLI